MLSTYQKFAFKSKIIDQHSSQRYFFIMRQVGNLIRLGHNLPISFPIYVVRPCNFRFCYRCVCICVSFEGHSWWLHLFMCNATRALLWYQRSYYNLLSCLRSVVTRYVAVILNCIRKKIVIQRKCYNGNRNGCQSKT